ncbi:transketolase/ C-terminal domain [Synechococcus sp. PROS-7-1]|uniref:hypothetical protein n=1 Tax=Synechococcus sp. PROS-7-1 TaxID=1442556 RepID=UPI0016484A80|nr:hypothetical protein [Synechococcus sp. PROS-7-1]QNI84125.1 transketolase/ C-terminal domain [Synechococcus sp. PROS-7-1]
MRDKLVQLIHNSLLSDSKSVLLTADLGYSVFDVFEEFRDSQYFNVGVSEQLMASMSCGLALEGMKVFCYSIGVFPTLRCLEQIRNDVTYHENDVTFISSGAGFSYGALGMSHHCVQDIGFVSSIPGITICTPANEFELDLAYPLLNGPCYLRIDKSICDHQPEDISLGIDIIKYASSSSVSAPKVSVLFHGSIGSIAFQCIDNNSFDLYSVPCLKRSVGLDKVICDSDYIITIEEHSICNGFASFISSLIIQLNSKVKLLPIALPHEHSSVVGTQSYLREHYDLTSNHLQSLLNLL